MTRDVFICQGVRTPIGRFGGALSAIRADDLAALAIRALLDCASGLDVAAVDEVVLGCANQAGEDNRNVARMAALLAGLPAGVPGVTVNRLCASGLEAVGMAARAIRAGEADLCIAGGVESMTRAPFVMAKAEKPFQRATAIEDSVVGWRFVNPRMVALHGVDSMPETAENVAARYGISREDQDAFALRSQQRVVAARDAGWFDGEIAPVRLDDGRGPERWLAGDEHPRPDISLPGLAKLKAPFRAGGTVTAGNSAGINDGAAALFIASADAVSRHGLIPRARILGMASAGVAPDIMGIGPVPAVRKLLDRTGLSLGAVGRIELNEAFAAQALAVLRELSLPDDAPMVNPFGGAIALGHPLGMSGARLALTLSRQIAEGQAACGIATLCVGVGQGLAMALAAA